MANLKIGIMGAGAIGGYLGIRLSAAGYPVTLIGRPSLLERRNELSATNLDGETVTPSEELVIETRPQALQDVGVCLLTVKSRSTLKSALALQKVLPETTPIVSLQNGIRNVSRMQSLGLLQPLFPGMVTFNVIRKGSDLAKGTSGPIMISADPLLEDFARALRKAKEPVNMCKDMDAIQRGKLLLNLNNGVCAATGLHILETVQSRECRWLFAECIREGLRAMRKNNQKIAAIGVLSPALVEKVLRLPNFMFGRLAKGMMTIDPQARSSTLQDLDRGMPTEIDDLNGEIVRLAEESGLPAPTNRVILEWVKHLERNFGEFLTPSDLVERIAG